MNLGEANKNRSWSGTSTLIKLDEKTLIQGMNIFACTVLQDFFLNSSENVKQSSATQ
jgi:hypothetical protein